MIFPLCRDRPGQIDKTYVRKISITIEIERGPKRIFWEELNSSLNVGNRFENEKISSATKKKIIQFLCFFIFIFFFNNLTLVQLFFDA